MSGDMFGRLPQFHFSSILSKLQCTDGLWDIRLQCGVMFTNIHACMRMVREVYITDVTKLARLYIHLSIKALFPGPAQLSVACNMEKRGDPGISSQVSMT